MKKNFEELLIEHCAPTLAGVKTGNLFCYKLQDEETIADIVALWDSKLYRQGVAVKVIKCSGDSENYLVYVYRKKSLRRDLNVPGAKEFLKEQGYEGCETLNQYIRKLSTRVKGCNDFPHEIGLFLGYPLADVVGFIENKGKNYHCTGCWKVYNDPTAAQKCFEEYKRCTAFYKLMYQNGKSIMQLTVVA